MVNETMTSEVKDMPFSIQTVCEISTQPLLHRKGEGTHTGRNEDNAQKSSISLRRMLSNGTKRKLLILDLNGLLADIVAYPPAGYRPDTRVNRKAVFKRPFCDDFLEFCFERFDMAVWSSKNENNVRTVVDFLMGDRKKDLLFCWDQSKCTVTGFNTVENVHRPLFFKELKKVWNKDEPDLPWEKGYFTASNTLLLDDSPHKALLNPPCTAIFPQPFALTDTNDNSLGPGGDLRLYLEAVAEVDDVQKYIQEHPFGQGAITDANPSWEFYHQVMGLHASLSTSTSTLSGLR